MGIRELIEAKKADGSIKNIGFSYHGTCDMFLKLLDAYDWDFVQIQYNYMDENSQAGRIGLEAASEKGIPVMKPDFWNAVDYRQSRDEYSYFFGDDIYVCPVIEKNAKERTVHLPEGSWTGFWDGQPYKGGSSYTVEAPPGRIPVFYRTESAFKELFRGAADI
jgi:hypothetical protein